MVRGSQSPESRLNAPPASSVRRFEVGFGPGGDITRPPGLREPAAVGLLPVDASVKRQAQVLEPAARGLVACEGVGVESEERPLFQVLPLDVGGGREGHDEFGRIPDHGVPGRVPLRYQRPVDVLARASGEGKGPAREREAQEFAVPIHVQGRQFDLDPVAPAVGRRVVASADTDGRRGIQGMADGAAVDDPAAFDPRAPVPAPGSTANTSSSVDLSSGRITSATRSETSGTRA